MKSDLRKIAAAKRAMQAELVIKNGNIVNVFTREIVKADIAIGGGIITGIGRYDGDTEIDAEGRYVCPGLIDSHVHMESSLVTPPEFIKSILPHGTTSIIADPHEIANVCGAEGVRYILDQTRDLPANVFLMAPSTVPALDAAALKELKESDSRIIGLGEVMDYHSVLRGEKGILDKLELFRNMAIDGHAPRLTGNGLSAYCAAGIGTDHECSAIDEVVEKMRLGMYIQIREGSAAKNLEDIVNGLIERGLRFDRCIFCTDDKHINEIAENGHIDYNVKKAIAMGVDPIDAVCMATVNAAHCYGLKRLGAVAPGYFADLLILKDLRQFEIDDVLVKGVPLAGLKELFDKSSLRPDKNVLDTVQIKKVSPEDLRIRLNGAYANVIQIIPGQIITRKVKAYVKTENGTFVPDGKYSKLAVVERHRSAGYVGLGIAEGFGITNGAIAGSVAHDEHNIIAAGDNDRDIQLAIKELERAGGGFTAVRNGRVMDTLELPVAGLMSDRKAEEVEAKLKKVLESASELCGNKNMDPFMTLSFLSLDVIPEIRLTDKGLYDVDRAQYIDIGG